MIIDIIIIVALLIAIILGIRQGLITQIFTLSAIIATAFVAPTVAAPIGLLFTDNELLAFTAGFLIMLLGAVILVWLIAPLINKLIIGKSLSRINSLIGACVALASMVLILSFASTTLNTANLGEPDTAKIETYVNECSNGESVEELRSSIDNLGEIFSKDASMREYFKPRFVEYEILDESRLFGYFVWIGDNICPNINEMRKDAVAKLERELEKNITTDFNNITVEHGTRK